MAVATAIAVIGVVAALAGAGVGAYSAVQAGEAADKSAKFNAAVARNNALMASQQAKYESDQVRRRGLIIEGKQRAGLAKSGVDLSGSGMDVMYGSQLQNEMDALAALYTGKVSATSQESRARLSELEGANAVRASYYNAGSSILSGAGSATSQYASYRRDRANDPTF